MVARPIIAGMGIAHPPGVRQDDLWAGFFAKHFGGRERVLAKRIFANSGVVTRHGVINPLIEDCSGWSTARRMERYLAEALPLGKEATTAALSASGVGTAEIGLFAVCSCTGYVTPGLDILLARDLGLAPAAQRLFVGHMGCYAALPGLGTVSDFVAARSRPALLLCTELTSLHVQPPTADPQQIVAHALFSDGAAAVVVVPGEAEGVPVPGGYSVTEVASVTDTATADQMTWDVTDLGFRMGLSAQVPDVLGVHVGPLVAELLDRHGLRMSDIDGWAVHPGGPRILDVVERELGLTEAQMAASRGGLAEHGNCSSATILLIIEAMMHSPTPPRRLLALAFGPGLTLYATLLTATLGN
jgi:predicted naringenin-chalcone synthase